ncbi:MAG: pyruvate ferredoxin oxidoreductase [Candidatus ainarchaeum sp.]|nr:pyruvate ferredoxin oxidoreductase [Candidatus ainarchaeum sp.]MDD3975685.1 pyruvate ferredoxin oxidoreductase [Candidatus ainarchaeum sp.]
MKNKKMALTGGEAISYALKQINPDVVAMYPITPQTPIIERYSKYVADGEVDTELIRVESEHSALSATIGAAASGSRAVTATASQGLLYMFEVLSVASGLRLPIVMPVVNRAISSPINIHCDHSDSMSAIDQGWMQVYCQNAQESYEMTLFATKLAEKVNLPIMVCQDGFITSHNLENIEVFNDNKVKKFIEDYKPAYNLLDVDKPISIGPLALTDYYFEIRAQLFEAFSKIKKEFKEISNEFKETFDMKINFLEKYKSNDAEIIFICLSSTAESIKDVIDTYRDNGYKVGLVRPVLFRPFFYEEYAKELENAKTVVVLDRSEGPGSHAPLFKDIVISLTNIEKRPEVFSFVYGLGGREIYQKDICKLLDTLISGKLPKSKYIGLRE